nr:tyrosine-type recombinase/integrase [Microbacterium sp. CIAB417]
MHQRRACVSDPTQARKRSSPTAHVKLKIDVQALDGSRTRASKGSKSWFRTAAAAAGAPNLTPHELRHTAASLAVQAGANVKVVQRMLGHASAAMTLDIYADLFDRDLEALSDAMDRARHNEVVGKMWANSPDGGDLSR